MLTKPHQGQCIVHTGSDRIAAEQKQSQVFSDGGKDNCLRLS